MPFIMMGREGRQNKEHSLLHSCNPLVRQERLYISTDGFFWALVARDALLR